MTERTTPTGDDNTPETDPADEIAADGIAADDVQTDADGADTANTDEPKDGEPTADVTSAGKGSPRGKSRPRAAAVSSKTPTAAEPATASSRGKEGVTFTFTGRGVLTALGVLAVVALAAATTILGWKVHQGSERDQAFDDAKAVSEEFVVKLVSTLNDGNTDKYKEIIGPLATGELRKTLEQERGSTEQTVNDLKVQATTEIASSSVQEFDLDHASTVVMAQVTGTSVKAPGGATNLMIFLLQLENEDGKWLVSKVDGPPGSERSGIVNPEESIPGAGANTQQQAPAEQPAPAPGG